MSPEAEKRLKLRIHQIQPLEPFTVGPYSVIAFPANHAPEAGAMLCAIKAEGRSVFYGTDTATLFEQTWRAFRQHKMRFDVVILDHTYGPDQPGSDHLSAHQVIKHANRMRKEDVLGPDSGGEIDVICGYRTPWSNEFLRSRSVHSGVARHSLHMQAEAIDIRLRGIPTSTVRECCSAPAPWEHWLLSRFQSF